MQYIYILDVNKKTNQMKVPKVAEVDANVHGDVETVITEGKEKSQEWKQRDTEVFVRHNSISELSLPFFS